MGYTPCKNDAGVYTKPGVGYQNWRDRASHKMFVSCTPKIDALAENFGLCLDGEGADTPMGKDDAQQGYLREKVEVAV